MNTVPNLKKNKIILAVDTSTPGEARKLIEQVEDRVGVYKIGLQLFTQAGPAMIRDIRQSGAKVFLDLKFHDIPNTVRKAVESACSLDVDMLTIHLSGGMEMVQAAVAGAKNTATQILGVTVLTSSDLATLQSLGIHVANVEEQVLRLAKIGADTGLSGVVCSPQEIKRLKTVFGETLKLVTPGVRPLWAEANDQKRVMTPQEAIRAGADYLVIGRPISAAPNPQAAAIRILEEIA